MLLELPLGVDTGDNERRPQRMDRKGTILYDVAQYDVVHVTPGGHEIGLSRGECSPPVMYFLVIALLAMHLPTSAAVRNWYRIMITFHMWDLMSTALSSHCKKVAQSTLWSVKRQRIVASHRSDFASPSKRTGT